jgi:hypothetical protein
MRTICGCGTRALLVCSWYWTVTTLWVASVGGKRTGKERPLSKLDGSFSREPRGAVAGAAVALIIDDAVNCAPPRRDLFAFPSVENDASNALCGRAGFELTGSADLPFRGQNLQVNVWRLYLAR